MKSSLPRASAGEAAAFVHHGYDGNGRLTWTSLPTEKSVPGEVAVADQDVNEYWDTGAEQQRRLRRRLELGLRAPAR